MHKTDDKKNVGELMHAKAELPANGSAMSWRNPALPLEVRVQSLVGQLTLKEKGALMFWVAPAIERLGIPAYDHGNEALHGVVHGGKFTIFPQAIGLAATFDPEAIEEMAAAIADEARARHNATGGKAAGQFGSGLLTFFSPTINLARDPRWGRTQETYGEDPHLTSRLGVAFVRGLQGNDPTYFKAIACPKHFAGNNEDSLRYECNAVADERYWHEYEFPPYRACVTEAKAQCVMAAFNAINGVPCTANRQLIEDVLREDWKFDGYVVTDAGGIGLMVCGSMPRGHEFYKTPEEALAASIKAGVDLELGWFAFTYPDMVNNYLETAVAQGLLSVTDVDRAVGRVLGARFQLGMFDPPELVPFSAIPESVIGCLAHVALARRLACESMVLLKNEPVDGQPLLPIAPKETKKILMVGPNAALSNNFGAYTCGQGPANPAVSPLIGLQAWAAGAGVAVEHVAWLDSESVAIPSSALSSDGVQGLKGEYFELTGKPFLAGMPITEQVVNSPLEGKLIGTRVDPGINFNWTKGQADTLGGNRKRLGIRWTGILTTPVSGQHNLRIRTFGEFRLILDGKKLRNWYWQGQEKQNRVFDVELKAGQPYPLMIEYKYEGGEEARFSLEWSTPRTVEALEKARAADLVVAIMGLFAGSSQEGTEGRDRPVLGLPVPQQEFIRDMVEVNPRTVVVTEGGYISDPILADHVPSVICAWYPGEQGGNALAEVLSGTHNPSGRLPLTFYRSVEQLRPFNEYDITKGRTYMYFEGQPLWAFGHGLSYTKFEYKSMTLSQQAAPRDARITVSVEVANIGEFDGDEVVQLYVQFPQGGVKRPLRQLHGFKRVFIEKGKMATVELPLKIGDLAFWDTKARQLVVEPGEFHIQAGSASDRILLTERLTVK